MNKIFNEILKARKGHYCHCVEVNHAYELESIADQIIDEFGQKCALILRIGDYLSLSNHSLSGHENSPKTEMA